MTVELLERAAAALGPLGADVVFVGGATLGVWITDPAAPEPRPTLDVDVVLEVASRGRLAAFEKKLRERGFFEDQDSGVICRWLRRDPPLVLDVMPSEPRVLGFASPWYPMVVRNPHTHRLPSGTTISVVEPALFLATKLEAFRGRGGSDYFGSRDFGDVISLEARAIAVVLAADERHSAVREVRDGTYVGLRDGTPVMLELVGMGGTDDEERLQAAASEYDLDAAAILAAYRAALGVPGREVTVEVAGPRAA